MSINSNALRSVDDVYFEEWMKFFWYNIPDKHINKESFSKYLAADLKHIPDNDWKPFCIYKANSHIKELEETVHDQETVNFLNAQGLDIYLTEPICSYIDGWVKQMEEGTKHTMWFYSEISPYEDIRKIRADEFDSIKLYVENNGLTNVTVHTCDYNVEKYYGYYTAYFKIITDDLFLKTYYDDCCITDFPIPVFTKKFINLNWRYTKHRHMVAAYLSRLSSHVSWYFKGDLENINHNLYFRYSDFEASYYDESQNLKQGIKYLNQHVPLNIDMNIKEANEIQHNYLFDVWPISAVLKPGESPNKVKRTKLLPYYSDSFCDVITETRFGQPTGNYSEKVYQAMLFVKPFILVAPPYTLEYLRSHGYKTFSDFWDESYDTETHHGLRLGKIFQQIDKIQSMTFVELRDMYVAMKSVLEHNRDLAFQRLLVWKS